MERRKVDVLTNASGAAPEEVIVLETVASVDAFAAAVNRIAGLEWLAEIDEPSIPPDPDFFDPDDRDKPLHGRLYLTFANQQALVQLLSLWAQWVSGIRLGRGFAPFEKMFALLKDVRPWGVRDRLEATGVLDDWRERVAFGQEVVRCEIELWYRRDPELRKLAARRVGTILSGLGGKLLQHVTVGEIAYDAILAQVPVAEVEKILAARETTLVQCEDVRLFGAVGQMAAPITEGDPEVEKVVPTISQKLDPPVAALLDGFPLQNHQRLRGRLVVDDPDGWEANYPPAARLHGTAMASLILHGDLGSSGQPLRRSLYVRPVMQARVIPWLPGANEAVPETGLIVDLVHRAVRRIAEGDGTEKAVAPNVCIVNFSIGDRARPFDGIMSPLARLLDYLAYRYKVMFVVSAGNWNAPIELDHSGPLAKIGPADLQTLTLRAVAADARMRRLLSPAESINVLTVAAAHGDASGAAGPPGWVDPYRASGMPSPINGQGMGYRRCIKPDVLMSGGRVLFQERIGGPKGPKVQLSAFSYSARPGALVATPGKRPGDAAAVAHTRGTSVAAALATRAAVQLYDVVDELRRVHGGAVIDKVPRAVWIRTMLVHAARWSGAQALESALRTSENAAKYREYVTRLVGYGEVDADRLGVSTDYRVMALGGGVLTVDQGHVHRFPLPPSLAGKVGLRRLTITLSYLTPTNAMHQNWRRAHVWFEPPPNGISVGRREADWQAVTRGTVQHEILEGDKADVYKDGAALEIKVSCRAAAGALDEAVPYALAVTLEVAEKIGVQIYDEIAQRVRPRVKVKPHSA